MSNSSGRLNQSKRERKAPRLPEGQSKGVERGGHDEKVNVCHSKLGGANWKLHAQTRALAMNIQMSDCWSRCNPVSADGELQEHDVVRDFFRTAVGTFVPLPS